MGTFTDDIEYKYLFKTVGHPVNLRLYEDIKSILDAEKCGPAGRIPSSNRIGVDFYTANIACEDKQKNIKSCLKILIKVHL